VNIRPCIALFSGNLLTSTRIEQAASASGYTVALWTPPATVDPEPAGRVLGEPLLGPTAQVVEWLSRQRPALIIFDLEWDAAAWREWLPVLTAVPATRNYPIVCFGPHVNTEALAQARSLGAASALARSRFFEDLPAIIEKYARRIDPIALAQSCQAPLSEKARRGLEHFNAGEYFEAHEWLELAWNEDDSPARELYRGILQVAVAYYHISRGNYPGAVKLFMRQRQWLDPLPDICRGVDVAALRRDAEAAYQALLALGPERIAAFDRSHFKRVIY
jgi:predicted metal-dependent hydrolase